MLDLLPYIVDQIEKLKLKHKVHSFDSGAIMVDIWIDQRLYVIQIDNDTIGISVVIEETTPFDIIPDNLFKDHVDFKTAFERIFLPARTIIIKGDNFSSLEGFYDEVYEVLVEIIRDHEHIIFVEG